MRISEEQIQRALAALRAGEAIVYPTETFYGVGVDALSASALNHLFTLKGREPGKAVALIGDCSERALALASALPEAARTLADIFWPGPLTLVIPARTGLPEPLIGPDGGVGVRVSPDPIARELVKRLGSPLTATSANLSGEPPAATIEQARAAFGSRIGVYLDGGILGASAPSTVISVDLMGRWQIIREGAITRDKIEAALGA
jgi:L-threonylcarbamoyladenylate synthase